MSESSFLAHTPSTTGIKSDHQILLVDHTISTTPRSRDPEAEPGDSDKQSTATPSAGSLYKRLTHQSSGGIRQSVRQEYHKQKYAKYGQDRYNVSDPADLLAPEQAPDAPPSIEQAGARQKHYLERAQSKVHATKDKYIRRKKTLGKGDATDTVVDILYENQRGMFFFGIPKYSSASLLPNDPKSWQDGQFRTSAVDIRNAQVPDPSWEWAWKSWYVDMSRDVDEEGWEYSFAFVGRGAATFSWHGNHPWFHSFVRRRRWLRMRKRRSTVHKTHERAHELTAEYFTIHPMTVRSGSQDRSSTRAQAILRSEPNFDVETAEILTVADLFMALRKSAVDREKIVAIEKFTDQGGDELYYLSESMEDIMKQLIFQSSRRQLLGDLISRHEQLRQEQDELNSHQHGTHDKVQEQHEIKLRHAENLHKAIHAADQQVKKLEYWSDMKEVSGSANTAEKEEGHNVPSFNNKQRAGSGLPGLPLTPAIETEHAATREGSMATSNNKSAFFDTESKMTNGSKKGSIQTGQDALGEDYEIAPETQADRSSQASNQTKFSKAQGKSPATNLDGVTEEVDETEEVREVRDAVDAQLISATTGSRGKDRRSVQIIEPIAMDPTSEHDQEQFPSEAIRAYDRGQEAD